MTLCIAWKQEKTLHLASDSRLTIGANSHADVGIKVLPLPFRILEPASTDSTAPRSVAFQGTLGMCFAGSAVNSLTIKEAVAAALVDLQYAPGYSDTSLRGICEFIFTAYKIISKQVCETAIGDRGVADFIICGLCPATQTLRAFRFSTNSSNEHSMREVLVHSKHEFLGSGADHIGDTGTLVRNVDYLSRLREIILDESIESVGGNIQYGLLTGAEFKVYGVVGTYSPIGFWRGPLDMHGAAFSSGSSNLVSGMAFLEPFLGEANAVA